MSQLDPERVVTVVYRRVDRAVQRQRDGDALADLDRAEAEIRSAHRKTKRWPCPCEWCKPDPERER